MSSNIFLHEDRGSWISSKPGAACGEELLDSIDTSTLIGLRDRALIALLVYTFGRISAALAMTIEDYYLQGKRWWVRLHEKGGKQQVTLEQVERIIL